MGGIFGIWNRSGLKRSAHLQNPLQQQSDTLAHRGAPHFLKLEHLHAIVLGNSNHSLADKNILIVFDGRIDNALALKSKFDLPVDASDPRVIQACYSFYGDEFAKHLDGDFAIALFDQGSQTLLLARDPIGTIPLYFATTSDRVIFSTEIKPILQTEGFSAKPHHPGVGDYTLGKGFSFTAQDQTCFEGVKSVMPSHFVRFDKTNWKTKQYWDFDTHLKIKYKKRAEYEDHFFDLFTKSVSKRLDPNRATAVSVSGGLDSSSIFCVAKDLSPNIVGISYQGEPGAFNDELAYLQALEEKYKIQINKLQIQNHIGLKKNFGSFVESSEVPLGDYMPELVIAMLQKVTSLGCDSILTGHWGDQILFSEYYLLDLLKRGRWLKIYKHFKKYSEYFGQDLRQDIRKNLFLDLIRTNVPKSTIPKLKQIRQKLQKNKRPHHLFFTDWFLDLVPNSESYEPSFPESFHSNQARGIYTEIRAKMQVFNREWNNKVYSRYGINIFYPMLDRDLLQFLMAIPGEFQNPDGVPRGLLRNALKSTLPKPIQERKWKADFSDIVHQNVSGDFSEIVSTLSNSPLVVKFGYVDEKKLKQNLVLAQQQLSPDNCTHAWLVSNLYGLEIWLKHFFEKERL